MKNLEPLEAKSRMAFLPPFREAVPEELPFLREPQAVFASPAAVSAVLSGKELRETRFRFSKRGPPRPWPFFRPVSAGANIRSYLLALGDSGLLVVDQHAAHERVLYEKFSQARSRGGIAAQYLLEPLVLERPPMDPAAVRTMETGLRALGFDWAPAEGPAYRITAIPQEFSPFRAAGSRPGDFEMETSRDEPTASLDQEEGILKTLACHGAVRAGQSLTEAEMRSLLRALDGAEQPSHCPHGRPLCSCCRWKKSKSG